MSERRIRVELELTERQAGTLVRELDAAIGLLQIHAQRQASRNGVDQFDPTGIRMLREAIAGGEVVAAATDLGQDRGTWVSLRWALGEDAFSDLSLRRAAQRIAGRGEGSGSRKSDRGDWEVRLEWFKPEWTAELDKRAERNDT